jgi:hypothetical protein
VARRNGASPAGGSTPREARKANALGKRPSSSRTRTPAQAQDARRGWAKRIRATWAKTIAAIIETGKQLNAAKADLPHGEFHYLVCNETPFHWSTADRLMAIARHPVLANFAHAQSLPSAWTTLYELSRLRPKRLLALIKDSTVSARMERQDAEKLVAGEIARTMRVTQSPIDATRRVTLDVRDDAPPGHHLGRSRRQSPLRHFGGDAGRSCRAA